MVKRKQIPLLAALILQIVMGTGLWLFSGCAVGPLMSQETARTVGNGNFELVAGYGQAGYIVKGNYGLLDDLDLGLHLESLSSGLRAKYAFLNEESGWSLALALGAGYSLGGNHQYGDLSLSYRDGFFEPYGTFRFVHIKTDPIEFKSNNSGELLFNVGTTTYDYGQLFLGTRLWIADSLFFGIEASMLVALSPEISFRSALFGNAAFGYRF